MNLRARYHTFSIHIHSDKDGQHHFLPFRRLCFSWTRNGFPDVCFRVWHSNS